MFDEQEDELLEGEEAEETEPGLDPDEESFLDPEEQLEELDVDDRGHVRPRRRSRDEEYETEPEY